MATLWTRWPAQSVSRDWLSGMYRVVAKLHGKEIEIPMGLKRPKMSQFSDYKYWLKLENEFAHDVKEAVESGELSESSVEDEMIKWSIVAEEEFKQDEDLKIEEYLLYLDSQIRVSLLNNSPPIYFIGLLIQLNSLQFTRKLILQNPQIVETIILASNYEEPIPQQCTSRRMVEAIRWEQEIHKQADIAMRKLKQVFQVPDDKPFVEVFEEHLKMIQ